MKFFKKFESLQTLNSVLIDQIKKNTTLTLTMYRDNYISKNDVLVTINERLVGAEQKVMEDTYHIDEVLYNEMLCVKEMMDKIEDIVPTNIYKQYNDIVLVANLMFDKHMTLDIIDLATAL